MARKSLIARNNQRIKQVEINYNLRAELRALAKKGDKDAQLRLNKMSPNSSYIRIRNRDAFDGRPRGYMRRFGVSRIKFRTLAHEGKVPGVKKASW
ncbi:MULTISPECIES: 30S ribosomal protein S14 [unclassified Mycoplasma]|uniref:30S ribosomal protein S14 n=1 Tax=unclassified Mycoplasma TaxID=2683645 RepID=UPI000FDD2457